MLGVGRDGPFGGPTVDAPGEPPAGDQAPVAPRLVDARERDAWVVLSAVTGVGPVSFERVVRRFGTATEVLRVARSPGGIRALLVAAADPDGGPASLTTAAAREIADAAADPLAILSPVRRAGVTVLTLPDVDYPSRLRRIALPPPVLFVRGSTASLDRDNGVAIVGTRRPTAVGRGTAARIADAVGGLGATVVSGLALGIDAAAHQAAVAGGFPTVAVIGGGHGRLYPAAHRTLVDLIVAGGGAVVSEFTPDTIPTRGTFPRRNRIISGLADATIVVEAGARSGALTTAAWALEQGRGLYIVPGRLDDPAVAGCLAFLREAGPEARIVAGIPELLEDLGLMGGWADAAAGGASGLWPGEAAPRAVLASLPGVERALATLVLEGQGSVDELVAATALNSATVLGALTALEMRGLVVEGFGRYRAAGALAAGGARKPVVKVRPPGSPLATPGAGRAA